MKASLLLPSSPTSSVVFNEDDEVKDTKQDTMGEVSRARKVMVTLRTLQTRIGIKRHVKCGHVFVGGFIVIR